MLIASCAVLGALGALVAIQSTLVWSFVRALRRFCVPLVDDSQAPPAAVVLCLRGTDPFLKRCIEGLLNQDYPHYQVRIVVDSPDDPAHKVLGEIFGGQPPTKFIIENLYHKSATCSLKCSSLRQVMRSLDPKCEVVAQLDADTIAHPSWLRELVTALQPADVGVATGNRWYMPSCHSIGSIVRYTWNAAAVMQMHWHRVAWGGTLAMKAQILRESDLLDKWGRAFCEDTMLHQELKNLGLKVEFVPSLMMINRENISLGAFYRWVTRQMVNTRLYHSAWWTIAIHALATSIVPVAAMALLVVALLRGEMLTAALAGAGLWVYALSLVFSLLPIVRLVRQIAERRGEPSRWISGWRTLKCAAVMPITQFVHLAAVFTATVTKTTSWRGIRYYIAGPWQIRMEEYLPYPATVAVQADESL